MIYIGRSDFASKQAKSVTGRWQTEGRRHPARFEWLLVAGREGQLSSAVWPMGAAHALADAPYIHLGTNSTDWAQCVTVRGWGDWKENIWKRSDRKS